MMNTYDNNPVDDTFVSDSYATEIDDLNNPNTRLGGIVAAHFEDATFDQIVQIVTDSYLDTIDPDCPPPPDEMVSRIVKEVAAVIARRNKELKAKGRIGEKTSVPTKLCPRQIADIMLRIHYIVRVNCSGENADSDYDILAMYQKSGPDAGIYVTDERVIKRYAQQYCYTISSRELDNVMELIKLNAPRVIRTIDRNLVAVNNGIFDFDTKVLLDFEPKYVFLSKSRINYNPFAINIVIHNDDDGTDWDVESWLDSLSDDPDIVMVLWEIMSAIVRPHVRWNKSAWLFSETGNNGKGTLCELMRSLCGEGSYAAIPLTDFGKDFALEPLIRSNAIIVDENDVGVFIDKAANLKAVITNDVFPINRKFKTPISYQFYGFMVQCLNEFPRIKDKSDSFYRRQLFIPFEKCFTGRERKYIKEDYLHRKEVLEYVLYRVLHMNFYTLSEPEACKDILNEYKEFNDPVRSFWLEFREVFVWDLLPFTFLYDLYKAWFRKTSPSGIIEGKHKFIREILSIVQNDDKWICENPKKSIASASRMNNTEDLIYDFDLKDWQNPIYTGHDKDKICSPKLQVNYRGIERKHKSEGE